MKDKYVSASELARMGYCERQVGFDAKYGPCPTTHQQNAARKGQEAHEQFYQESLRLAKRSARRGPCFVATLALGESQETLALRQFRDLFLRRSLLGRVFIATYYRYSPKLCQWLQNKPTCLALCRLPLRLLAQLAQRAVNRRLK